MRWLGALLSPALVIAACGASTAPSAVESADRAEEPAQLDEGAVDDEQSRDVPGGDERAAEADEDVTPPADASVAATNRLPRLTREALGATECHVAGESELASGRGRFLPVRTAARIGSVMVAWGAPDGHVYVREVDATGAALAEPIDTGLLNPTDIYAPESRDAGFWLLAFDDGYVIATHRRASRREPHVLYARALDARGRPLGSTLELPTARLARPHELLWRATSTGIYVLHPPQATLTRLNVGSDGLTSVELGRTERALPLALAGDETAASAIVVRSRGADTGVFLRAEDGTLTRTLADVRPTRVMQAERIGDRVFLLYRSGGAHPASWATWIERDGQFSEPTLMSRSVPLPEPLSDRLEVAVEDHWWDIEARGEPEGRSFLVVDAARRRVTDRVALRTGPASFSSYAAWTGRGFVAAVGMRRRVVTQQVTCP